MRPMRLFLFYIGLSLLGGGCSSGNDDTPPEEAPGGDTLVLTATQVKNAGVETGIIDERVLSHELRVNGLVDVPPQNMISVSFPLGGYLRSTQLMPGMKVRRGEVIAVMEDPALIQLQQDYLMAQARLQFLREEYERQKLLHENQVNADKTYQQASADFTSQKVLVSGLAEKLRLIRIDPERLSEAGISRSVPVYSPINGFVSRVNVNIGRYVTSSEVLFELINPDDMHAALTVFEKDLAKVRPGQKVQVEFVDEPGTWYDCDVILVTRNVDENRSALVHCHFEKQPGRLLPGMFLNARIHLDELKVLAVPETAVVRYGSREYVLEAEPGNRFSMVPVQTGIREDGWVELSGHPALRGKTIVTRNPYPVLSAIKNTAE